MLPTAHKTITAIAALLLVLGLACDFSPTAPFEGFDGKGSRISGTFTNQGTSGSALRAQPQSTFDGITVFVRQDPSLETDVKSNGTFVLSGLPGGTITIVFQRDGQTLDQLTFHDVMPNQEIRIVLELTDSGRVNLLEEDRDDADLGSCARSPGFWCQNQDGKNPNLSAARFQEIAEAAAALLNEVDALDTPEEIRSAICNTSDQLLRHLAVLGLNLAAELVSEETALEGEEFATVGEAFDRAVALASDPGASRSERNAVKDVLDRINNNRNTATDCSPTNDDDGDSDDDDGDEDDDDGPSGASCSGAEIPRGHFPPPGECKIWDPRLPAGQQGPPGNCNELCGRKPAGTCVIDHNGKVVC